MAAPATIRWANPQTMAALAWDLRSDSVTLGLAFSTPVMDFTDYRTDNQSLDTLSTRYHSVYDHSYSLWGTIAVGLKLKNWFLLGGSFNFGYTHNESQFLRDGDTAQCLSSAVFSNAASSGRDAMSCAMANRRS